MRISRALTSLQAKVFAFQREFAFSILHDCEKVATAKKVKTDPDAFNSTPPSFFQEIGKALFLCNGIPKKSPHCANTNVCELILTQGW